MKEWGFGDWESGQESEKAVGAAVLRRPRASRAALG